MADEKRATIRHRVLKGGHILINGGQSSFDCMVRNLSAAGALLRVTSIIGIPHNFDLAMDDGRHFACRAIWRTETEIGVAFV